MLEVSHLCVRYENRSIPAVQDISFSIGHGEFVVLAGDSASGKSTVMQAVCRFIPEIIPAELSGSIRIDGDELVDPIDTARFIAMVQQDPETQFCTETVEEEVAFGLENLRFKEEDIRRRVHEALEMVNASHLIDQSISTLSGGEKQKVAIASMLALDPRILILDEPTSSLDPKSVAEVVSAIEKLRTVRSMTVVIVEHRVRGFIDMATRIILMDRGKIVHDFTVEDLKFAGICKSLTGARSYPKIVPREGTVLTINNLSYQTGGKKILDDVGLTVTDGAVVALMGENGAGKTTLLKHIMGLIKVSSGSIEFKNHRITENNPVEPWILGRDIGLVFQNPNHQMFEKTVEKEIKFGPENFGTSMEEVKNTIASFESTEGVRRYVHPQCLSFGQKRRVNIRSASAHGPSILLLDEPFAGQDENNVSKIMELLANLQRSGKTIIVVTHDIQFARGFCTDALIMRHGRVVADGPIEKISEESWQDILPKGGKMDG
ncbi:MAG: ATP-binding cassette domain-containing protein [Candidatus Thermoplasmatota archaeon]|nr:ATP-binding cassette domain-containing protein [Candidatus Thermoplasmatota archaeon]